MTRLTARSFQFVLLFAIAILFSSCDSHNSKKIVPPLSFLENLKEHNFTAVSVSRENASELILQETIDLKLIGVYSSRDLTFALYDGQVDSHSDLIGNELLHVISHHNLSIVSKELVPPEMLEILVSTAPSLTIQDAGVFIYPLGICLIFAVFVMVERFFALRRGVTFPSKVEKALRNGEFPGKKWKKKSSAERIVWVAIHEKASPKSLNSYTDLEISSFYKGLFILEIVVSGAPLIGLLGTVTGLVKVFSAFPSTTGSSEILAEGIGLALLTTILGLSIAIPSLLGHSYFSRLAEKRSVALRWVAARTIDATSDRETKIF